jgi:hypothetical protein
MWAVLLGPTSSAAHGTPVIDPDVRVAVARGSARVLLDLRVAGGSQPEAELPTGDAVARQRAAIATAQQEVAARLTGTHFRITRQYTVVPMMAMGIGADALAALETMGDLVARVRVDSARPPVSSTRT